MQVRGSPVDSKRSFLEKKGLTPDEIAEAFKRVPETPSASTPAAATGMGMRRLCGQEVSAGVDGCLMEMYLLLIYPGGQPVSEGYSAWPQPDSVECLCTMVSRSLLSAGLPSQAAAAPPKPYPTATADALQQLQPAPLQQQQPQPIRWTQVSACYPSVFWPG